MKVMQLKGMSLPVKVILAGTLLIVLAMIVVGISQVMLTSDYGTEVSNLDKPVLDRACAKWRSMNADMDKMDTKTFAKMKISKGGTSVSLDSVCESYFGSRNSLKKCMTYCIKQGG